MSKGHQENTFSKSSSQAQGNKSVNLGFKKTTDNVREPLKCWGCGEPQLLRNCPYINDANKTI
jgi:hypothetical protein